MPVNALLMLTVAAATAAGPMKLSAPATDSVRAAIQHDRNDALEELRTKPTSYLVTIQRRDFNDKDQLTVGRDPDNDVRIDDPEVAAHHLRVTVRGDSFHV